MTKIYRNTFEGITSILIVLLVSIGLTILISALQERPSEHPLDFQSIDQIPLEKSINSVEDGLPFALRRARKWRKDAILTGLQVVSVGKEQIKSNAGIVNYRFEFACVDKSKPSGVITISINTASDSIELVDASHEYDKGRKIDELELHNLEERIKKLYNIAIKTIGKKNISEHQEPLIRANINKNYAIFEYKSSLVGENAIKNKVKIDMKTYNVLEPK